MLRAGILLYLTFLVQSFCIAQIPTYDDPYLKFDHLTKKDGLTSNYILEIFQDKQGYIWIATIEGLNRYNGYQFMQFKNIPGDSTSLSHNLVTSIAELADSSLVMGTKKGLNIFDQSQNTFSTHIETLNFPDTLSSSFIRDIYTDIHKVTWIETAQGFLVKANVSTGEMKFYKHGNPTMVNTYFYHSILHDSDDKLWLGGRYMGLYNFNPETEKFIRLKEDPNDNTKKRDEDVAIYFEDSEGTFWVGGTDGLYILDRKTEIFTKILPITTLCIAEDDNKNLWIGTGSGLFVYDMVKKEFRNSVHNDNNPNSIIHDHINNIFIDRSGNVWLGTIGGISIFRPSKNKFKHIYHIAENENTPVSNSITSIVQDNKGRIWLGTSSKGVEYFDIHLNKLGGYNFQNQNKKFALASDRISTMMVDSEGDIWIGQWSGRGFNIINPDTKKNIHRSLLKNSLKADWYNDFMQTGKGDYYVGIWGSFGLFKFDKKALSFTNQRYVFNSGNTSSPVYNMSFDGSRLWLDYGSGRTFFYFSPQSEKYYIVKKNHYFEFDFTKILNLDVVNGQSYFYTNTGIFKSVHDPYLSIIKTSSAIVNPDKKIVEAFNKMFPGITVHSYVQDLNGNYWLGSNHGLNKVKDGKIIQNLRGHFPSDTILSLAMDPQGALYLGTNKGLAKFDIKTNEVTDYSILKSKYLSSHLVKFLFEDSHKKVWVGTTNQGLNRLNPKTGDITHYPDNPKDSSSFWGKEAICMIEDSQGNLWVGGNGLNKYLPASDEFKHFTKDNGLADNEIKGILEDEEGSLWISTANGLSKFNPETQTFINYYEKDGLQENEFSEACFKLQDGRLVFGGKNGLNIIDPKKIYQNKNKPSVVLSGFKIFDKPADSLLSQAESIRLKYNQNYFSFDFAALDFSNPEKNVYAYKLENFHEDWVFNHEGDHTARYTNVDPGKYIFRVKAANSDGYWNEEGISIPLIIKPPFWKTPWFYGILISLLVILIFIYIKYRERKMREQNKLLILEQKLLRSQMNPHFIFNSLSSIQSFIFENNPVEAGSYLSRFAELIRSILYNSREDYITLENEIKTLKNYFELQQLRYNHKFDFDIDIDPEIFPEDISIPPMIAQPFIENAVEHGIKYIEEKGLITVSFTLMNDSLLLTVEDNGIGIKAAKNINGKKASEHKSLATIITHERIEILNKGRRKKLYSMQVQDTTDATGKVNGTRVKLIIPFLQT
jgi:ligand-binding sensor domain-containing protein/two-component sensor histidine kinase